MGPLSEEERDAVLDGVALVEAFARDDLAGASVLLNARDDPVALRQVLGCLAYMVARVEDVTDPEVLAAIRRSFAGRATSP
jgi:hypothetical protein